jgi:hypothetical protein
LSVSYLFYLTVDKTSTFYDDCAATCLFHTDFLTLLSIAGKIKEILGETKDLTLHKEKMKKFDELVTKFPDDLEIPVDIPFLRKVVRRVAQNAKKRKENADRGDPISPALKLAPVKSEEDEEGLAVHDNTPKAPPKVLCLHLPEKSTTFASITFDSSDFVK